MDFDIHLEGGDALLGASALEVHITEVVFETLDIGENGVMVVLFVGAAGRIIGDQAHRDARDDAFKRNASGHQGHAVGADRSLRAGAVAFNDIGDAADGIRESLFIRNDVA